MPLSIKLGKIFNIYDYPDKRKEHQKPIIRIGGLGIVLSFYLSIFLLSKISIIFFNFDLVGNFSKSILILPFLIFLIGFVDDIYSISPFLRLIFQILISICAWFAGIRIEAIDISFLNYEPIIIFRFISLMVTILWLSGMTNAINWVDGSNGVAGGISFISLISISIMSYFYGNNEITLLAITLAGSSLGFLKFNLKPNKIIMGDSGSNFLGFNLALLSLIGTSRVLTVNDINFELFNIFTFLIFFIPIFDMVRILFLRILDGASPFLPDKRHLHHFLLMRGNSVMNTFYIFCLITIFTNAFSLFLVLENNYIRYAFLFLSILSFLITKQIIVLKKSTNH
ncbi:undecaprenyl/decaprenyl-phosphate alpha-N-acetylglucosaminyl 1-phosphate transferase [Prochlorococcus sp. AH-716-I17]|nr:undecaprenyl/decaprenyl-phosphate alpha-N-acetylglucosaminyl 1-phosphate transferase [Prochlorococcus sp. AH-716-I17]